MWETGEISTGQLLDVLKNNEIGDIYVVEIDEIDAVRDFIKNVKKSIDGAGTTLLAMTVDGPDVMASLRGFAESTEKQGKSRYPTFKQYLESKGRCSSRDKSKGKGKQ